ncbi:MAG: hypothetical protein M3Y08_17125, partial [Fibrobacterota bacterium]|nr:hypothetical protein [Fibrobacterota bacterium]
MASLFAGCMEGERSAQGRNSPTGPDASELATANLEASQESGLDFPSNGQTSSDIRFRFTGSALLPMYPATYIWRVNLRKQAGYYATFYWGPSADFTGTAYFGAHPYPDGEPKSQSTAHKWALALDGFNYVNDAKGASTQLGYDVWKIQGLRVFDNGANKIQEFYWDLPDTTKVIRTLMARSYGSTPPSSPALTFGSAPWAPFSHRLSGILRGIQLYSTALSQADLVGEVASPQATAAGASSIWYLNMNPTPGDILDKSGKGHNPGWVTSARAGLWTGATGPSAPTVSLSAKPTAVATGGSSTLTWSSTNATSCNAGGAWSGSKALSGNQSTGSLTADGTFTLTCAGDGGSASQSVTVSVTAATLTPTLSFTASPASMTSGGSSTLTWSSTNATACDASGAWNGVKAVSGTQSTGTLTATGTFTYTLSCTGSGGTVNQSATVTVTPTPPPQGGQTGLDFPSNGQTSVDICFRFTGSNLLSMYPATYIWKVNLRRQTGYYTTFFWGPSADFTGTAYYGAQPYPIGEPKTQSTAHNWALALDGSNFVNDAKGASTQLGYDVWRTQGLRVFDNGTHKVHEFYWDLPDTTKVIRTFLHRGYGSTPPPSPALTFGAAPWARTTQRLSGILRGIQLYSASLSQADLVGEVANPLGTATGSSAIWYLNLNPTPGDITDKSGKGHNPTWVTTGRPALWSDSEGPVAPTVTLTANPTAVSSGGSSTLTWSSTNATACDASGAWNGVKAVSGTQSTGSLTATGTFTYTMSCTG